MEKFFEIQKMLSNLREDLKGDWHNLAGDKIFTIQVALKKATEDTTSLIRALKDNILEKQIFIDKK